MTRRWRVRRVVAVVAGALYAGVGVTSAYGQGAVAANPPRRSTASFAITMDRGPVGMLLKKWEAEGTAAGNDGDLYDNRDRGHSMLALANYPQLRAFYYTMQDRDSGRDWAVRAEVVPGVVFGNSSTSSSATISGSNTRLLYASADGLAMLHQQYRRNNLYIYPSHQDYRGGHNGIGGGWGDLFPANTPYLITSLGSSGSDQPFMNAVAVTLAAFRPEVKRKLVEEGMLMPAVQMIFRMCNKQVQKPEDYLTGKAHPVVFDGDQVDALKMVQLAHEITPDRLPPLAQVLLLEEEKAEAGTEYFDPMPETLAATPGAIARIYRAMPASRRVVVSAALSKDLNGRPLTYRWVLLRGDATKVQITPKEDGKSAEICIAYHPRIAAAGPGGEIEGNRVDIGLIVHNGVYYSAPAFVTSFTLDSELRTYDAGGRIVDVGYDVGWPAAGVKDYVALFAAIQKPAGSAAVEMLRSAIGGQRLAVLAAIGQEYSAASQRVASLQKDLKDMEDLVAKAGGNRAGAMQQSLAGARDRVKDASGSCDVVLDRSVPVLGMSVRQLLAERLGALVNDPMLYVNHQRELGALSGVAAEKVRWLVAWDVMESGADGCAVKSAVLGTGPVTQRMTRCEQAMLCGLNAAVLAAQIPGVSDESRPGEVDFRLTIPKDWRDVYRYGPAGEMLGWRRYSRTGHAMDYDARGEVVVSRDEAGRPAVTRNVVYQRPAPATQPSSTPDTTPLTVVLGDRYATHVYRDASDMVGRVERVEHR